MSEARPKSRVVLRWAGLDLDRDLHLAIGIFDGVHLGHQAVVESAARAAHGAGGLAGVLTFWPHPSRLLRPQSPTRLLMPPRLKTRLLLELGVDLVIWKRFNPELAALPADRFLPTLRRVLPTLRAIHVGENFRFGQHRAGDVAGLAARGPDLGIHVYSVERLRLNGEPISSSRIRAALAEGRLSEVNRLLGRPYGSEGAVVRGRALARQLGFPTLNFPWAPEAAPRHGVYAVRLHPRGERGRAGLPGVANYGRRPTVEAAGRPLLEVHTLAPCRLGPGDRARVEWLHFLRPEQTFPTLEDLRRQIGADLAAARDFFQAG